MDVEDVCEAIDSAPPSIRCLGAPIDFNIETLKGVAYLRRRFSSDIGYLLLEQGQGLLNVGGALGCANGFTDYDALVFFINYQECSRKDCNRSISTISVYA
ncbi:Hypothetical protein MVR_LOCUS272 [uncultured virus]|nr:Hypothetical protein MVR_LOCUS272 [uncultured virus]